MSKQEFFAMIVRDLIMQGKNIVDAIADATKAAEAWEKL